MPHVLRLGEFTLDPATGNLSGPGGSEQIDPKVMQVLLVLAQRAGNVVPRQDLLQLVWPGVVVGDDVVSRCIYQLRRHLRQAGGAEHHAALVETLPRRGYRLNCGPPEHVESPVPSHGRAGTPGGPEERASAQPTATAGSPLRSRWRAFLAGVLLLGLAAAGAAWLLGRESTLSNPLTDARFTRVTDFEGVASGVAISRDGKRMAFLANRDGQLDAWITQPGTKRFQNLTQGRLPGIDNVVRSLGFSPDASDLLVWKRVAGSDGEDSIHTWAVSTSGGPPRPYLDDVAEVAWSADGQRMVFHPAAPGDPLFVTEPGRAGARQIYVAPHGVHCHFPVWSPDGRHIYFVQGRPPDDMDLWRIAVEGGQPERLSFHASRVSYPVFVDRTTLLYLAADADGSGPWLHAMDTRHAVPHRIASGLERYTSLAASADGRRLVATRTLPRTSLWRARLASEVVRTAERAPLPAAGGKSPRFGPGYLLLVAPADGSGLHKLTPDGRLIELWNSDDQRLLAGPAIEPGSGRIAFTVAGPEGRRLRVMDADGKASRTIGGKLQVTGSPAWSPDGSSLVVAAEQGADTRLFRIPLDGSPAVPLAADFSRDPAWSPDGSFLVFNGADVGPAFRIKALSASGRPFSLPDISLPRGARRIVFLPGTHSIVVAKGTAHDRNFWLIDLQTGRERQLTDFDPGYAVGDFDVSAEGSEIIFDQLREESDVVQIDLAPRGGGLAR